MTPQRAGGPAVHTDGPELHVAIAEVNERYRSLFTHNPHAALSFDREGHFIDVNPVAEEVSGYPRDVLCGMHFAQIVEPEDLETATAVFRAATRGESGRAEARIRRPDGAVVDVSVTAIPVLVDGEVVGVHGIAEDVTERHRLICAAEEAIATKSLFLANMSHEVRTPLTSVLAAAELLRDADLDEHAEHLVQMIERSGERLLRLVTDILDASKLGTGTLELLEDWINPHELVREVVEAVRVAAETKGVRLECRLSGELPDKLWGDALRVSQVIGNLAENAVKFTEVGEVIVTAEVLGHVDSGMLLGVQVSDTGIGIAPNVLDDLFERFAQADPTDTRPYGGAGLGLAICRDLVHLMGGSITARSAVGTGSTFSVTLPLSTTPNAP